MPVPWTKITREFAAKLYFGKNGYEFSLVPTPDNRLIFQKKDRFLR